MSDYGDQCRELRDAKRAVRAKHGVPCPECVAKLPKAHPSILLPQQICKIHKYRDPRPHDYAKTMWGEAGYERQERFRLIQDGQPVAWVEGNNAVAEILHYAAVYAQDGPVIIQKKVSNGWKKWKGEASD